MDPHSNTRVLFSLGRGSMIRSYARQFKVAQIRVAQIKMVQLYARSRFDPFRPRNHLARVPAVDDGPTRCRHGKQKRQRRNTSLPHHEVFSCNREAKCQPSGADPTLARLNLHAPRDRNISPVGQRPAQRGDLDRCEFHGFLRAGGCIARPQLQSGVRRSGVISRKTPPQIERPSTCGRLVQPPARRTSANCGRWKRPPQAGEIAVDAGAGPRHFSRRPRTGS